jgi:FMN-dependent NADH-azoreductase
MTRLLHVNASPRGDISLSLALARTYLDTARERRPDLDVDTLDLFTEELPEFGTAAADAKFAVFSGGQPTGEQADAWRRTRAVFDRFAAADEYLFNVPQWNCGIPYRLKHWIDLVTQPGWSFGFDPVAGYDGLITGRRATVVYTAGVYAPGRPAAFGVDFHSTYFDDWLRFVGIADVTRIRLDAFALSGTPELDLDRAHQRAREAARTAYLPAHAHAA